VWAEENAVPKRKEVRGSRRVLCNAGILNFTLHQIFWMMKFRTVRWMGHVVDCVWNVMAHAQKPDFVFRQNGRVHLNRQGRPFSRLLAAEECASAVVMLDAPCSVVVWRILATHFIRQFPLHFPSRASPCAITFQLDSNAGKCEECICNSGPKSRKGDATFDTHVKVEGCCYILFELF